MKIQWKFADGTTSEVEVNEEIGSYITASRREESNLERKERSHCYSLDAIDYEGLEYAADTTPETEMTNKEDAARVNTALDKLTETQQRRLLLLADGLSMREIARREGVDHRAIRESIEAARKKFKKNF
jgi:RNA polymerase sigma factor (sigma-70 family)